VAGSLRSLFSFISSQSGSVGGVCDITAGPDSQVRRPAFHGPFPRSAEPISRPGAGGICSKLTGRMENPRPGNKISIESYF